MRDRQRTKFFMHVTLFALVFSLTARPTLNAAESESSHGPTTLARSLFERANELSQGLHKLPL